MGELPSLDDFLTGFAYPPCVLAGIVGGLVTRRLLAAVVIAAVLAVLCDIALAQAFSDPQPRARWGEWAMFAVIAALEAGVIQMLARLVRARPRHR